MEVRYKNYYTLSFFSGGMGLDLGLEKAGFHIVSCCENNKFAKETIQTNRKDIILFDDILHLTIEDILKKINIPQNEIFLVCGGPPCQAFSTAGKRRSFDDVRGNAFLKYLELATEINPQYILIENVRGLMSAPLSSDKTNKSIDESEGSALWYVYHYLLDMKYTVSFNLYNTANYGVPQCRERIILIATRHNRKVPYLFPTNSDDLHLQQKYNLQPWKNIKNAFHDLPDTMECIQFSEKHLKYYRLLKSGQNWRDLPKDMQREAMGNSFESGGGKTGFYRRLDWNAPSPTLVTSPAMPATSLAHPELDRPLSVEEYKRIQCFPDNWFFSGKIIDKYRQIGNAVPMEFGKCVGITILHHFNNIHPHIDHFPYSRYKDTSDVEWLQKIQKVRMSFIKDEGCRPMKKMKLEE